MSDTSLDFKDIQDLLSIYNRQPQAVPFEEITDPQTQLIDNEKQNVFNIYCSCYNLILRANLGTWVERPRNKLRLPEGQALRNSYPETPSSSDNGDPNQGFWALDDVMAFEHIGVSKAIDSGIKYIMCGHCYIGPLGYNDPKAKEDEYLLAVDRVHYSRELRI